MSGAGTNNKVQQNMGNKRKGHLSHIPSQDIPRSRCSSKKFITAMRGLSDEKLAAISAMGFGGLLQLATIQLRHELCTWLMSAYDIAYHRIRMATSVSMEVRLIDVEHAMGIPCDGLDVPIHPRRVIKGPLYNIQFLEAQLQSLPIGDDFRKIFLIFTCATILAPNSKPEGMHDLWDFIWGNDVSVRRNWGKLLLYYLEDGIAEFLSSKVRYVRGCLLFLQIFYLTKTYLPKSDLAVRLPWCAMWPNQVVNQRLAAEIKLFGRYGLVEIKVVEVSSPAGEAPKRMHDTQEDEEDAHSDDELNRLWKHAKEVVLVAEANLTAIEELRRLKRTKQTAMQDNKVSVPPMDSTLPLTNDASLFPSSPHHDDNGDNVGTYADSPIKQSIASTLASSGEGSSPYHRKNVMVKMVASRRLVKPPHKYKSTFVKECVSQYQRITYTQRYIADYALADDADNSEILVAMFGRHITRGEMKSLASTKWINNAVVGMVCRVLNAERGNNRTVHYFEPSFAFSLNSFNSRTKKDEIIERTKLFLDCRYEPMNLEKCDLLFLPVCESNHWHLHVVNIASKRVEILSSTPIGRNKSVPQKSIKLTKALFWCLQAWGLLCGVNFTKFEHVCPDVAQQSNSFDCGMFVIKYMEHWDGSMLTQTIDAKQMKYHRVKTVCTLIVHIENEERRRISKACDIQLLS